MSWYVIALLLWGWVGVGSAYSVGLFYGEDRAARCGVRRRFGRMSLPQLLTTVFLNPLVFCILGPLLLVALLVINADTPKLPKRESTRRWIA